METQRDFASNWPWRWCGRGRRKNDLEVSTLDDLEEEDGPRHTGKHGEKLGSQF